jgi:hypothetical protein
MKRTTITDAIDDEKLFKSWFRDPATWGAWLFALPLTADELAIYRDCTGRTEPPSAAATEAWLICGRRAGKSFVLALCAIYLGCFHVYRQHLTPGERATVMVIARDRKQTRVIINYIRALLLNVPMLARMVERETADSFDLSNGVSIELLASITDAARAH